MERCEEMKLEIRKSSGQTRKDNVSQTMSPKAVGIYLGDSQKIWLIGLSLQKIAFGCRMKNGTE